MLESLHLFFTYFLMKNEVNSTNTIKPTNPPFPSEVISAVKLATTSIPNTAPPVKMYHKIVTGRTANKTVPNPPMVSGLAYFLSMKFAPQRTQEMKLLYEDELARSLAEDGSPASTYITPKTYYPNI